MNGARITVVHLVTRLELGGAQLNTLYTVEHLDPLRFDVYLLCGPGGMLKSRLAETDRLIVVPSLAREIRVIKDLQALVQLVQLFKRIRPQIVHTHSSKAGILGRLAARLAGVPVVVHTVHGFSFSPFQSFAKRNFYRLAETFCRRLTSHFVFVARGDIDLARRHKLVNGNFSLIRSGFPLEKFLGRPADPAALKAKYALPEGGFVCGIIAPFKPQKGLMHLAAIAALVIRRNPAVIFFIAGDGEQRHELEAELRRLGIAANFRLPGFVPDVENAMDGFDVGVSTALWEGLPQSLVQLRLKKKAVVASDIPGNREVVRDGENGFLLPVGEHQRFADAILRLAADAGLRRRLGDFSAEDFGEWSAAVLVARQEELYQRLLVSSWTGG
jgi:glycosyltransferase involved in cell wall biosynthesis